MNGTGRQTPPLRTAEAPPAVLPPRLRSRAAFTLVELLVAIAILVVVSGLTVTVLTTVTRAWQRGTALSEDLHHGDYVIEQLVTALRAARYRGREDGLQLIKGASYGSDTLAWVKEGPELVGDETTLAKTFHHIRFMLAKDEASGKVGAAFSAWGDEYMRPDDFEIEKIPPTVLSDRVVGFSCRVATNCAETGEIDWLDSWEDSLPGGDNMSNHVPRFVEITVRLKPLDDTEDPIEMRRLVEIPIAINRGFQ